ncbi:MAG: garP 1 [Firmicutes bacterium]|nr:garP 1 [Bacillota bacterium]
MGDQIQTNAAASKKTWCRWFVLLLVALVYCLSFMDRVNIGVVLPVLRSEYSLTNAQAGQLASMYFVGYIIAVVPAGFLISKYGSRSITLFGIIGFSLCTFLIGTATSANQILWYRVGLGSAEAPIPPGGATIIKSWFPNREQATASGIFMGASTLGMILAPPVAVWILVNYNWNYVFYFFAIPGFIISVLWRLLIRNQPEQMILCNLAEQQYIKSGQNASEGSSDFFQEKDNVYIRFVDKFLSQKSIKLYETLIDLLQSRDFWGLIGGFCFMGFVSVGIVMWIPAYLVDVKAMQLSDIGWLAAAQAIGGLVGCVVGGMVSDNVLNKRRKPNMLFTPISVPVILMLLIDGADNTIVLGIELILLGFFLYIAWSCYFAYLMQIAGTKIYPIASAIMIGFISISGFFSPIVCGYLLDVYKSYDNVFYFWMLSSFMSLLSISMITEMVGEKREENNA